MMDKNHSQMCPRLVYSWSCKKWMTNDWRMSHMLESALDFMIEEINNMIGHHSQPMYRSGSFSRASLGIRSIATRAMGRWFFSAHETIEGEISAFVTMSLTITGMIHSVCTRVHQYNQYNMKVLPVKANSSWIWTAWLIMTACPRISFVSDKNVNLLFHIIQ